MPEHDDELDLCDESFVADAVDDDEVELLALFPDGVADEAKAAEWGAVFAAAGEAFVPADQRYKDA